MTHKNLERTAAAHKHAMEGNFKFVADNKQALEESKGGQSPNRLLVMCGDSRCAKSACMGNHEDIGDTFGGSGPIGNVVSEFVLTSLAYNVDHLKTPYALVVGHTGCGAIIGSMGDFSGERNVVQKALTTIKNDCASVNDEQLNHLDETTQNAFKNVQAQVLKIVDEFKTEVDSGQLTVLGAVYDNQGLLGEAGLIHYYTLNGNTDADGFMSHAVMAESQDEKFEFLVKNWRNS